MTAAQSAGAEADAAHRSLVVFSLDEQRYALPLDQVRRAIRVVAITPLPEAPAIVLGIIDLGGVVTPVIDLRARFNHPAQDVRLSDHLIVAATGRRTVVLLVDDTRGVIDAPPESLVPSEDILPGLDVIAGAIKLEDGLILIHDLERRRGLEHRETDCGTARRTGLGRREGRRGRYVLFFPSVLGGSPVTDRSLDLGVVDITVQGGPTQSGARPEVEERITGSYPGGPRRDGDPGKPARAPRLERAEDIEARFAARSLRHRHRARSRRIAVGFWLSLALAGTLGWFLGKGSHRTVEELNATQAANKRRDVDISAEVNRTLLELWKMEDVEAARNRGRTR
ncbi:MAG: chemotaxis protein CheW [Longimicrobiales bacterium]|nr:chemotaxis protein CheW [Longimicrobiales bacterium]